MMLTHEQGVLSALLSKISSAGGSVLTITQSLPIHGKASVTLSLDISAMPGSMAGLIESLGSTPGRCACWPWSDAMNKKPRRVFCPQAKINQTIFTGGVYVGENTSRSECRACEARTALLVKRTKGSLTKIQPGSRTTGLSCISEDKMKKKLPLAIIIIPSDMFQM